MSETDNDAAAAIRFERHGRLGMAVLDRQATLNALTREMVQSLSRQLVLWGDDPDIAAVLVRAVPGRAFCAGGDIRHIVELAQDEGMDAAVPFFRDEYRLDWRTHTFPKPYLALLDGITMGGGVGISVHGRCRIVTENTVFAMPETGIGFFPDVGGTWFLPRCPGEIGMYLGLAGARIGPADCFYAGIGTHFVPAVRLDDLMADLIERLHADEAEAAIEASLRAFAGEPGAAELPALRERIDRCFGGESLAEIIRRLEAEPTGFGAEQLATLAGKSPLSLHVAFRQLREGKRLAGLADGLRLEYRLVHRFLTEGDFAEGVRALIIDKDKQPRWRHPGLDAVPAAAVDAFFAPLPQGELRLDWQGI
jgi:enoyl-CoA hydratase